MLVKDFAKKIKKIFNKDLIIIVCTFIILLTTIPLLYSIYFQNKIYPGVEVTGINISNLDQQQALNKLKLSIVLPQSIVLKREGVTYEIPVSSIDVSYDFEGSIAKAYSTYRTSGTFENFLESLTAFFNRTNLPLNVSFDKDKLLKNVYAVAGEVTTASVNPTISEEGGNIVVNKGQAGQKIDSDFLINQIGQNLENNKNTPINISVSVDDPSLTDSEAQFLQQRAQSLLKKVIIFKYQDFSANYNGPDLFSLLDGKNKYNDQNVLSFIDTNISSKVNRDPQNAVFQYIDGKVQEFKPGLTGINVNNYELKDSIKNALGKLESSEETEEDVNIPVSTSEPQITTAQVNNLGIKELIGKGTSRFMHSIPSRVHNVVLASSKFNGALIAPGDTFSFDSTLGDVSAYTGYQQAYIIQNGRTVLGDGGGVCQVSTTLFRAVLNAGLPIVERHAHAYRVGYYEQDSPPGLDATVFSPTVDFKFKNDTPGYILVQTEVDTSNLKLTFELYGTSDGRVTTITKPVVSGVSAPPPDLYQDDPTLPVGIIKQVDFAAWGAKVSFNYNVTRDGQTVYQKQFVSSYSPWQAIFLKGTGQTN